jgi:NADPH:quinone reductase
MIIQKTMKQVQIHHYGAPDVMQLVEVDLPQPQAGEVLIESEAIGINFADSLRRRNVYFMPTPLPYVLGSEVVGHIRSVGEGVSAPYLPGTRVLGILPSGGGYSEFVTAQAQYCVPLPTSLDPKAATAIFVQGTTAQLMISQIAGDMAGKTVLINAAAGGVGSILVQLAKLNGARVIAASSSNAKLDVARSLGADALINYTQSGWATQVMEANGGQGVDVVFEMVGGEVYNESLRCLARGGHLIVYGAASQQQGRIHPEYFVDMNITQSGFNLAYFIGNRPSLWQKALEIIISLLAQGKLTIQTAHTFTLKDAAEAHRQLESRSTIGKVVLVA